MNSSPAPLRTVAAWATPALTTGSTVGLGVTAVITHDQTRLIIAGIVGICAIAASVPKAIEVIYIRRSSIIRARGDAQAATIAAQGLADAQRVVAESEAKALDVRTRTRAQLLLLGAEPDRTESAATMLRLQGADPDLPADRRLNDVPLARLLTPPKSTGSGGNPRQEPPTTRPSLRAVKPPARDPSGREPPGREPSGREPSGRRKLQAALPLSTPSLSTLSL